MKLTFLYSLRFQLFVFVLLVIAPVLILTIIFGVTARNFAKEQILATEMELARNIAQRESIIIDSTQKLLELLSWIPDIREGDEDSCRKFVKSLVLQNSQYLALGTVNLKGDIVCSSLDLDAPVNVYDRPYIRRALETQKLSVSEYQISRTVGKPALNLAQPIFDNGGNISGLAIAVIDLEWLTRDLGAIEFFPPYTITIIDRNGIVLSRFPDSGNWVGKMVPEEPLYKAIAEKWKEGSFEALGLDNVRRLFTVSKLGGSQAEGVYLSVGVASEAIFSEVEDILVKFTVGLLALYLFGLLAAFHFARKFLLEPIGDLAKTAGRLGEGRLESRTSIDWRKGEFGRLARVFDSMAQSLENQVIKIKQAKKLEENQLRHELELEKKERDFISVASHQLQTPLALIRGYLLMVISGKYGTVDENIKNYLVRTLDSCDRITRLVRDLLSTARIDSGRLKVEREKFNIISLTQNIVKSFENRAQQKGLDLIFIGGKGINVLADADKTAEILTNLVDNAIKFTNSGKVTVRNLSSGRMAKVEVSDTGIGVIKKDLPRIFEKFYFSENWISKQSRSSGLGLYIAMTLAKAMSGNIEVESTKGKGSKFTLTLPLAS